MHGAGTTFSGWPNVETISTRAAVQCATIYQFSQEVYVADYSKAKYAQLREKNGQYILTLFDEQRREVGFGYKGPTLKRAKQDLKYWIKHKGLEELPE